MFSRDALLAGWIFAGLLAGAALAQGQAIPDLGFTTRASAELVDRYARRFNAPVANRVAAWATDARGLKAAGFSRKLDSARGREDDILQDVNHVINSKVRGIEDKVLWGVDDYWATPAEAISVAGGDCEDYALAKYYLLKELGVPLERLRVTYVRLLRQGGAAHMILAYYVRPDAEPLILDNLDAYVRSASQRADLDPVYSFNDDEVQLVKTGARGKPAQIRAWLDMQGRLIAESKI